MSTFALIATGTDFWAYLVGIIAVLFYLLVAATAIRGEKFWKFLRSDDGRLSTSKFQFFVWTGVVVFTFAVFQFARYYNGQWTNFDDYTTLPANVLWAMGLAAGTSVLAKGVAASADASGKTTSTPMQATDPDNGLVASDDGTPDLSKIQMLTWTGIAVVVYLAGAIHGLGDFATCTAPCKFPDISATLLTLMGIGQAGYLGAKLTGADPALITGISPHVKIAGAKVTITGQRFGNSPGAVTADGEQLVVTDLAWSDSQIRFTFPQKDQTGADWPPSVIVGANVGGNPAANPVSVRT